MAKRRHGWGLLSLALAAALGPAAPAAEAQDTTWDMALAYAETSYHSENAARFAAAVTAATGGALEIVTHPGGSLFKGNEIFGAVRSGEIAIGERLISALGAEDPIFEVDALPFLATGFEAARALYDASKPAIEASLEGKGLKLLYAVPWPPQGLYAKGAVNSLADLAGSKFRAYNAATSRLAELMGAEPTRIRAAEISRAFASGAVESMISAGSTGYDRRIWQHVRYWYDVQAWLPKNMVVVNLEAWGALDETTRGIVLGAAAMAEQAGWAKAEELADWYREQLAANGMEVDPPGEALRAELEAVGQTMVEDWLERAGDVGRVVIETYRAQ